MKKDIIFIGAGGHAKSIYDIVYSMPEFKAQYYIDEKIEAFFGLKKMFEDKLLNYKDKASLVISIGGVKPVNLELRLKLYEKYKLNAYSLPNLTHQSAIVSTSSVIKDGVTIGPGCILNAKSHIGECAIINTGAIIEHDVHIDEGVHICPGAIILGGAKIGKCALIGAGAIVLPNAIVPENYVVAANTRFPK